MNSTSAIHQNMSQNLTVSSTTHSSHPHMSGDMAWGIGTSATVLAFVGFTENLFVVSLVFFGEGFLEAPSNIFLLSLGMSEVLLCSVTVPLLAASLVNEAIVEYFINSARFSACVTVGSLFLLSANRALSIEYSLKYPAIMTVKRAILLVASLRGIVTNLMGVAAISYAT